MNSQIIDQFSLLVKQAEAEYLNSKVEGDDKIKNNEFRLKAIKNSLNIIRKLDFEITDAAELKGIKGIGDSTIRRVTEILETGKLSELKNKYDKKKQKKIDSIQELEMVIGIGSSIAKKLVLEYNIKSIDELKTAIKKGKIDVSEKILLGLKYYGIVEGNIPRAEVTKIKEYLEAQASKIDSKLEIMICGSYRRGKQTSGDIDLLLYHPDIKTSKQVQNPKNTNDRSYLEIFIDKLTAEKFLLDHMTDKNYSRKYMGFCKYNDYPVRRIDIRFVPYRSLQTAMLYFTGPYELNTIMRTEAKKRGMVLNEYGLYIKNDDGTFTQVRTKSEKDVFTELGMKYLTPEERETFNSGRIKKTK